MHWSYHFLQVRSKSWFFTDPLRIFILEPDKLLSVEGAKLDAAEMTGMDLHISVTTNQDTGFTPPRAPLFPLPLSHSPNTRQQFVRKIGLYISRHHRSNQGTGLAVQVQPRPLPCRFEEAAATPHGQKKEVRHYTVYRRMAWGVRSAIMYKHGGQRSEKGL